MFQFISYYLPLSLVFLVFSIPILIVVMLVINFLSNKTLKSIVFFSFKKIISIIIAFSVLTILFNLYLFEVPVAIYKCSNNSQINVYRNPTIRDSLVVRYNSTGSTMQVSSDSNWDNSNYQFLLNSNIDNQSKIENKCLDKKARLLIIDSPQSTPCKVEKSGKTDCPNEILVKYGLG